MPALSTIATVAGIAGATASVGSSIAGMVSGSKAAGSAADSTQQAADAQTILAQKQSDLAQAQWDRYLSTFAPFEDTLLKTVQEPVYTSIPARESPGFLAQMGTINRNFANAGGNIRSMMGGKNPYGSGVAYGAERTNELNRTKALSAAESTYNQNERQNELQFKQNQISNMLNMANIGRGLSSGATSGYGSAASTYGNAASTYNNLATMYGNAAGSAGSSLGSSLGNLYQMYALSKTPSTTTTPSSTVDTSWYDPSWLNQRITG